MPTPAWFRRLATATAILTYALIVIGGIVRVTESGLGCPDWPTCYGQWVPPLAYHSIIESSHRLIAGLTSLLTIGTAVAVWLRFRRCREIFWPATISIPLLGFQIGLGAWVVFTELQSSLVAFHLGIALTFFACVIMVAVAANYQWGRAAASVSASSAWLIGLALAATFAALYTGALVVDSDAYFACPDWPLCHGGLLPPANADPRIAIHILHRYAVVAASLFVFLLAAQRVRSGLSAGISRKWLFGAAGLFAGQIVVGAMQVFTLMDPTWRGLHLALAAAVWAALVVIAAQAFLTTQGVSAPSI